MHKPDGDMHIFLKPDPEYAEMLNDRNVTGQRGNLVLEPVCVGASVPWIRLRHACDDFKQAFDKSLVGQHVQVVGAFVTDMDHGWNEIHPVTSIARK